MSIFHRWQGCKRKQKSIKMNYISILIHIHLFKILADQMEKQKQFPICSTIENWIHVL